MSQENVEVMRSTRQRDLPDRLVVRVPALAGLIAGAVFRAKPGSSLRRRLVNLQVKRGFASDGSQRRRAGGAELRPGG